MVLKPRLLVIKSSNGKEWQNIKENVMSEILKEKYKKYKTIPCDSKEHLELIENTGLEVLRTYRTK